MQYVLGNMLNGGGGLNPDKLSLDLQFAADKTLTARKGPTPVFTRASTATFVGSDGLIQSAAINTPRFDHDSAGVCRGLLIEESRTNLLQRSEDFNDAYWTKTGSSISSDSTTSPSGSVDADKIVEDTSNGAHGFSVNPTITSGIAYTLSFYAKAGERSWVRATVTNSGVSTFFDLANGVLGNVGAGVTASIQDVGNGWYRCIATMTSASTAGNVNIRIQTANGQTTYTGDDASGAFFWGAQLEAGSFPTSYIPTVASSVVRSADVCSITGSDFSGMFNANDGTLFSNCSVDNTTGTNRGISSIRSTATFFMRQSLSNGSVRSETRANDTQTNLGTTSVSILTAIKMALAYSGNDFASSTNGASPSLVTRTLPTGLSEFRIGALDGTLCLNGHLVAIRYFRKRLPNAKLQALTA
jgi:hypothetical protein